MRAVLLRKLSADKAKLAVHTADALTCDVTHFPYDLPYVRCEAAVQ